MYLRQAGLTRNPTFSYLYCVRCRGHHAASEAPLERKYSRYAQCRGTDFGASNLGTFACRTFPHDTKASKRAKRE
jgi:hypothetical protein